jgi:hypothetical protein
MSVLRRQGNDVCYNALRIFQRAERLMFAIEFQSKIRNGIIEVPAEYRERLRRQSGDDTVRVIVLTGEAAGEHGHPEQPDILYQLLNNPLQLKGFRPLKRDETHERH